MEIRHNLVLPEKPFFRRGCCVVKAAHYLFAICGIGETLSFSGRSVFRDDGFSGMKHLRLKLAVIGVAFSAAACAALWPHARQSAAVLAAQDDPAELSDIQINSALRNNQSLVADNIERALAAGDADLAASFVELAKEKNILVSDELLEQVRDAVTEANSASHFAKGFASGLITGNADDVASMSGTVAGDLFVFGDIRDVVGEGKHLAMGEDTDRLVLGLAAAGLAVTAATYVSVGGV